MNYYNEIDPKAAAWLRALIVAGEIPNGIVDERSITEVRATDLVRYTQCHFFAGIGGWSLALKLAGWPEDRPVWTGSCPCQPFSAAGKGLAQADERHLWPAFFNLIKECRPEHVFGEQVASAIGHGWLDGISSDLESEGYSCGAVVLGAHSVLSPHQRQRLYWMADSHHERCDGVNPLLREDTLRWEEGKAMEASRSSETCRLDDTRCQSNERRGEFDHMGRPPSEEQSEARERQRSRDADSNPMQDDCELGYTSGPRSQEHGEPRQQQISEGWQGEERYIGEAGFWSNAVPILCTDGKYRRIPTEPALFPLADGLPYKLARRGSIRPALLHGAGNAIVPQVAAEFIQAYLDTISEI